MVDKTQNCSSELLDDKMKTAFKYFKRKCPPPTFECVLNFHNGCISEEVRAFELTDPGVPVVAGLQAYNTWKAYTLRCYPGFVFIVNPFTDGYQKYWVQRCLRDYHKKPSKTNLDLHMEIPEGQNVWDMGQRSRDGTNIMDKLRWATLGYHHDWNTKVYSEANHSEFPSDLSCISYYIAAALGYPKYKAQAAIINYYHMDSTLSGHTDHSEMDKEAPLISISFGQTAIFLLGGLKRSDDTVAMYLQSGDIAVMMGPSRLAYHAVPRVLDTDQNYVDSCLKCSDSLPVKDTGAEVACASDRRQSNKYECSLENPTCVGTTHLGKVDSQENLSSQVTASVSNGSDTFVNKSADGSQCKCLKQTESKDHFCYTCSFVRVNQEINDKMAKCSAEDWAPYECYMRKSRINMNVRQVFKSSQQLGTVCSSSSPRDVKRQKVEEH